MKSYLLKCIKLASYSSKINGSSSFENSFQQINDLRQNLKVLKSFGRSIFEDDMIEFLGSVKRSSIKTEDEKILLKNIYTRNIIEYAEKLYEDTHVPFAIQEKVFKEYIEEEKNLENEKLKIKNEQSVNQTSINMEGFSFLSFKAKWIVFGLILNLVVFVFIWKLMPFVKINFLSSFK